MLHISQSASQFPPIDASSINESTIGHSRFFKTQFNPNKIKKYDRFNEELLLVKNSDLEIQQKMGE